MLTGFRLQSVSPGAVDTEFVDTAGLDRSKPEIKTLLEKIPWLKAEDIADAVLYTLSTPPHVQIHELTVKPVNESI